jgi:hypothetical protein
MWTSAAFATTKPLQNYLAYEEIIFSVLYGLLASCLGMFVSFFYCIARSDVRAQWHLMECWCKKRRGRCCRTRSISDTNPAVPTSQPLGSVTNVAPRVGNQAQPVSSSNSINSSAHTSRSHNSNVAKAAIELNGTAKCDFESGGKISNVNLVVLHRQQYRSNNSVTTFTEPSGASGVEMFYNPHQSTVARKFFRKQRRHMKHNNLGTRRRGDGGGGTSDGGSNARAESSLFLSSDIENASGKMAASIYAQGSKVNNTNIHIECPRRSSQHKDSKSQNPNILTDSGGDEGGLDSQGLPLERLVIGADDNTSTSAPVNNDGIPRGPSSCSASLSSDTRINLVKETPEEVIAVTAEVSEVGSEIHHEKNKDDCNVQCLDSLCDELATHRTLTTSCSLESFKTEAEEESTGANESSEGKRDPVVQNADPNGSDAHLSTENMDLGQKFCDLDCSSVSVSESKSSLVKYVHNSLHGRNPKHSKQDKCYSGIDVVKIGDACIGSQKPRFLMKGKKLSLPSGELNGYGAEDCIEADGMPTVNKKETSV